jgi:NAD(P)-dependent dehydrogenase (short-subunit alcohol dehydrogenase family)
MQDNSAQKTVLLIGASRGLGFAMVEEYLKRGWRVIATGREGSTEKLRQLSAGTQGALEVEAVDITIPDQVAALHGRLMDRRLDVLFVNAGVKNDDLETIADISTEEFVRVMVTNSLSPMRLIEAFQDLVQPAGTIGVIRTG